MNKAYKVNGEWCKRGADLRTGDVVRFLGQCYTVTHFEPHPGHTAYGRHYTGRIACSGDWVMTVLDDADVRVVPVDE